jgi:ferredoxin
MNLLRNFDIVVHRRRCLANGNCVEQAPGYFQQSAEDGRVVALRTAVSPEDAQAVQRAVALCPVAAIELQHATPSGLP